MRRVREWSVANRVAECQGRLLEVTFPAADTAAAPMVRVRTMGVPVVSTGVLRVAKDP